MLYLQHTEHSCQSVVCMRVLAYMNVLVDPETSTWLQRDDDFPSYLEDGMC